MIAFIAEYKWVLNAKKKTVEKSIKYDLFTTALDLNKSFVYTNTQKSFK